MRIDFKSFILGTVFGWCLLKYRASVAVARDTISNKPNKEA